MRRVRAAWKLHVAGEVKVGTLAVTGRLVEMKFLTGRETLRCGLIALVLLSAYLIDYGGGLLLVNTTKAKENCGVQDRPAVPSRLVSMTGAQFYNHTDYTRVIESLYDSAEIPTGHIPGVVVHDPLWRYDRNLMAGLIACEPTETTFKFSVNVSLGVRSNAFAVAGWPTQTGAHPVQTLDPSVPFANIRFDLRHGRYMQPCELDVLANCATHFDLHYLASWPESPTSFNILLINLYEQLASPLTLGRLDGGDIRVPYTTPSPAPALLCKVSLRNTAVVSQWGEMNLPYVDRFATYLTDKLTKEWNINVRNALQSSTEPQHPETDPVDLLIRMILSVGTDLKADDYLVPASFAVPCSILSYFGTMVVIIPVVVIGFILLYLAVVFYSVGPSLGTKLGLIPVSAVEWAGLAIKEAGLNPRRLDSCQGAFEKNCDVWLVHKGEAVTLVKGNVIEDVMEMRPEEGMELVATEHELR
ncbi:hypothetical protein PhCBS80983_g02377 [Powellomyces hirtus]|uniref:Uncharacterized protein n=1 Tax=Powellomyces hirtus TaxID=109895 RepID=A0A507E8B0_9FUNG|nr:hypothetical protein PhCBS80983_g02377 [Powellomyces hirtus]